MKKGLQILEVGGEDNHLTIRTENEITRILSYAHVHTDTHKKGHTK